MPDYRTVPTVCEQCGKAFLATKYAPRRFCSRECSHVGQQRRIDRVCAHCGETFSVIPARIAAGRGRYCSQECKRAASAYIEQSCAECGRAFMVKPSLVTRGEGKYCSMACSRAAHRRNIRRGPDSPRWRGGSGKTRRRSIALPEYRRWRRAVLRRDGYTCQCCGEREKTLTAHHMERWIDAPRLRFDVANGLTLCLPCHRQLHSRRRKPIQLRFRLS